MWDNWKKKIKRLFTNDDEDHYDEHIHMQQPENHHPEAKMMYQYPAKKSFRFPVIPDLGEETEQRNRNNLLKDHEFENSSKQSLQKVGKWEENYTKRMDDDTSTYEVPAFKRRGVKTSEYRRRDNSDVYKHEQSGAKVYKKSPKKPFQPTEVPSPIYGFHPRNENKNKFIEETPAYQQKRQTEFVGEAKEKIELPQSKPESHAKEIDETPAYQRKQDAEVVRSTEEWGEVQSQEESCVRESEDTPTYQRKQHTKTAIGMIEEIKPYTTPEKRENDTNSDAINKDAVPPQSISVQEQQKQQEQEKQLEEAKQQAATTLSNVEQIAEEQTNSTNVEPKRENRLSHRRRQQQAGKTTVPFNVMMTPRDKKNLWDRTNQNRAQEGKDKQKHVQTVDAIEKKESEQEPKKPMPLHLLNDVDNDASKDKAWMDEQQQLLEQTLKYFNVQAKVVNVTQGPAVTRFEVQPQLGVKVSKVKNLSDDLKLNMAARDIRIEAPIPGKNTIGIEIPNPKPQMVGLQGVFETEAFQKSDSPLTIALGLSIEGDPLITNIQKMPHGLIAGATGSGKSVCINTILISLLYKAHHEEVKFLLIDPKMVELAPYNGIPHLVSPVITDVKAATAALKWAVAEMEERYEKFVHEGVRDVERYNEKMTKQQQPDNKLPFIVIVIDELADLMMVSPQDVEDAISRIAQKARACGIHLLLATQRPSVDVITGLIKANIPTRIAFSVSSQVDSRTILDTSGAEKLLGKGDMLFIENGSGKSVRLQGPFVSDEEIDRVASYVRGIAPPNYLFEQEQLLEQIHTEEEEDELLQDAILFVLEQNGASTSLLQRHFKIGYNRAARLIDTLEQRGIISGQNGSKPREVLVTLAQVEDMLL
ncbi:DNA translocase SftA [Virgibacillus pantothenticus]|uniref:DNA translocase FtsK n=1 Tax=Virgibacillus pantothenticus TaxID=1473 RepID=UPI001B1E15AB|nr:DNA translocase FtsK [Virgibacillus pantothenticus]MBU8568894.1 DNA translocase FtsK [Virgibacillus pantothenticus]MBU8602918.1 DNA translocase FtsK [Virgibacillus pantothenticus]MBU8636996.1 DNA translocase FtsK [Virgibacillus pantothenticus]MBU8644796.1 DNA translocase FtsK [Virgibacillus pantothenticus]MBU8648917.1 DNA translocase FtsK [Virgibacillus pantothenticus]